MSEPFTGTVIWVCADCKREIRGQVNTLTRMMPGRTWRSTQYVCDACAKKSPTVVPDA